MIFLVAVDYSYVFSSSIYSFFVLIVFKYIDLISDTRLRILFFGEFRE